MIQRPTLPDLRLIESHFQLFHKAIGSADRPDSSSESPVVDFKALLLDLSLKLTTEFLLGEASDSATGGTQSTKWTDEFAAEFNVAFK